MKFIKKTIISLILIILLIIFIYYANFYIYRNTHKSNEALKNYIPQNNYEEQYPIQNYVTESTDVINLYKNTFIKSLLAYDNINNQSIKNMLFVVLKNQFNDEYNNEAQKLQYEESELTQIKKINSNEYQIEITNPENNKIYINMMLFGNEKYNITIPFVDSNNNVDSEKAKALSDDSNSEALVYYIIETIQIDNNTQIEPNEACYKYFGTSIERLAGDISYHAVLAYILSYNQINDKPLLYDKVKDVNIAVNDSDSVYMNRAY